MKKVYILVILLVIIGFLYFGIKGLSSFTAKLINVTTDSVRSELIMVEQNKFKSTEENTDLTIAFLNINTKFIANPPIEYNIGNKKISNFHQIESFFPNFEIYYKQKLKISKIIYSELEKLQTDTKDLSNKELKDYYFNNTSYLYNNLGFNSTDSFESLIHTIKDKEYFKPISCNLDSSIHLEDMNSLNMKFTITLSDKSTFKLGILIPLEKTTNKNLFSPDILIYGLQEG